MVKSPLIYTIEKCESRKIFRLTLRHLNFDVWESGTPADTSTHENRYQYDILFNYNRDRPAPHELLEIFSIFPSTGSFCVAHTKGARGLKDGGQFASNGKPYWKTGHLLRLAISACRFFNKGYSLCAEKNFEEAFFNYRYALQVANAAIETFGFEAGLYPFDGLFHHIRRPLYHNIILCAIKNSSKSRKIDPYMRRVCEGIVNTYKSNDSTKSELLTYGWIDTVARDQVRLWLVATLAALSGQEKTYILDLLKSCDSIHLGRQNAVEPAIQMIETSYSLGTTWIWNFSFTPMGEPYRIIKPLHICRLGYERYIWRRINSSNIDQEHFDGVLRAAEILERVISQDARVLDSSTVLAGLEETLESYDRILGDIELDERAKELFYVTICVSDAGVEISREFRPSIPRELTAGLLKSLTMDPVFKHFLAWTPYLSSESVRNYRHVD
ncbi:hypothetical protein TWF718_009703 [Orbilia javanica]|uniref:Uncharacterized protein n=1 Tax=Orbilia javanica TaxID=47235 RepID=A0AAN8MJC1_9PEZI